MSKLDESVTEKVRQAMDIIGQTVARFGIDRVALAWSGGKDSTVALHLIKSYFQNHVPIKIIRIATPVKFPEINAFIDRTAKQWGLDLHVFKNEEAIGQIDIEKDKKTCCRLLKITPLNNAITTLGIDALLTSVRRGESPNRAKDEYFSEFLDPHHYRVRPILDFTEADIWAYIKSNDVPFCVLYDRGYRSIGCIPCTQPASEGSLERSGRSQAKESIMGDLRNLGYF